MKGMSRVPVLLLVAAVAWTGQLLAGPPYNTDDPEPVEYRHWEFYLASQHTRNRDGWSGTAPHFEVNYGALPDMQLHLIVPLAYAVPNDGGKAYGIGDTELGVKYRFVQEQQWVPQVGTFPFLEVPTGSRRLGLGNGTAQVFLPLWLQKSVGAWTTYGGAGFWFDAAIPKRHWWYVGGLVQRRISDRFTLGVEVFHLTAREPGTERDTRFNRRTPRVALGWAWFHRAKPISGLRSLPDYDRSVTHRQLRCRRQSRSCVGSLRSIPLHIEKLHFTSTCEARPTWHQLVGGVRSLRPTARGTERQTWRGLCTKCDWPLATNRPRRFHRDGVRPLASRSQTDRAIHVGYT
jgi:hypothetical protein